MLLARQISVVDVHEMKSQSLPFQVDSAMVSPTRPHTASAGHMLAFKSILLLL